MVGNNVAAQQINWTEMNKIYSAIRREGERGIYLAELSRKVGWSERQIGTLITPLIVSGIIDSRSKKDKTKNGMRTCRVLSRVKNVHMRTMLDQMIFEQVRTMPGRKFTDLVKTVEGIPRQQVRSSLNRLHDKGVIKFSTYAPKTIPITYKINYNKTQIYPIGVRL
jgi:hypothetical protein